MKDTLCHYLHLEMIFMCNLFAIVIYISCSCSLQGNGSIFGTCIIWKMHLIVPPYTLTPAHSLSVKRELCSEYSQALHIQLEPSYTTRESSVGLDFMDWSYDTAETHALIQFTTHCEGIVNQTAEKLIVVVSFYQLLPTCFQCGSLCYVR